MFFNSQDKPQVPHSESCTNGSRFHNQCKVWQELAGKCPFDGNSIDLADISPGCQLCEASLADSVSDEAEWWQEAKTAWLEADLPTTCGELPSSIAIELQPSSCLPEMEAGIGIEPVSLDFLGPPVHPELLGRLDRYDIERVIGIGGMGVVLRAFDADLHRVVAIKVLSQQLASNGSARRRFAREAQAVAAVVHPNVIPVFNVESSQHLPYLVMQYVSGGSLQSKVDRSGPLTVEETLRIARQAAAGLAAAHEQGLVHRDVKPANILLEENVDRVLLSDFGLARAADDASLTRTGVVAGTPHYMSPEQARGDTISFSSDLFSLGSVIYFMLSGKPPFRAHSAMGVLNRICHFPHQQLIEACHQIPQEISHFVDQLLEKQPSQRPESAARVLAQIDQLLLALQSGKLHLQLGNRRLLGVTKASSLLTGLARRFAWHGIFATVGLTLVLYLLSSGWIESPNSSEDMEQAVEYSTMTVREFNETVAELNQWQASDREWSQSMATATSQLEQLQSLDSPIYYFPADVNYQELQQLQRQIQQLSADSKFTEESD